MMKYSPYDNVKKQAYPTMLVEISYNDSQVPYWEGMKFAAKIREMKTDRNLLLVRPIWAQATVVLQGGTIAGMKRRSIPRS